MAAFDWYQGTVDAPVDDLISVLDGLATDLRISHQRGRQGYAHSTVLGNDAEGAVAQVWHGGTHSLPHFLCSGEWAQPGAELIRVAYPFKHTIARVDVREDFGDRDAFDRMQVQLLDVAKRHRIKVGTAGDHLLTKKGRTTYLGAPTSAVRMRLYDKAQELRDQLAKDPARLATVPEHLARLEAQVRPQTRLSKAMVATMEPVEVLGSAKWMREVWRAVAGLDLQPVQVGRGYRQADDERAYRFLLAQYGGVLRRMQVDQGSWECVGLQIGSDLARRPT
jgi:hypothetical protein